jgi:hypothetical protein
MIVFKYMYHWNPIWYEDVDCVIDNFLCVLHDDAFFLKDSKPITRKDVVSADNRTQYCTFTAEMCIHVYTCGGQLNPSSKWMRCRFEHASWMSDFLYGFCLRLTKLWHVTLTFDLNPNCPGHQPVTTVERSANLTLSSLAMSVPSPCGEKVWPLTLTHFWVTQGKHSCYKIFSPLSMSPLSLCGKIVWPLTLTHFWVIQGQHSCYSISQVFTDLIFKWHASGRKASIFDFLCPSPRTHYQKLKPFYICTGHCFPGFVCLKILRIILKHMLKFL